jgi:hypothetical protein
MGDSLISSLTITGPGGVMRIGQRRGGKGEHGGLTVDRAGRFKCRQRGDICIDFGVQCEFAWYCAAQDIENKRFT